MLPEKELHRSLQEHPPLLLGADICLLRICLEIVVTGSYIPGTSFVMEISIPGLFVILFWELSWKSGIEHFFLKSNTFQIWHVLGGF